MRNPCKVCEIHKNTYMFAFLAVLAIINKLFPPLASFLPTAETTNEDRRILSWTRSMLVPSTWGGFTNLAVNWISSIELISTKLFGVFPCLLFVLGMLLNALNFLLHKKMAFQWESQIWPRHVPSFYSYPAELSKSLVCLAFPFFPTPLFSLFMSSYLCYMSAENPRILA